MPQREPALNAHAGGNARQINMAGDNFGPIYLERSDGPRQVHQLPAAPQDFSGRADLVAAMSSALTQRSSPKILNLHGLPGVGKSALVVRAVSPSGVDG